jgi:acetyl-CoA synthetase
MSDPKSIASIMTETRVFDPPATVSAHAWVKTMEQYEELYNRSIADPEAFWAEMADNLDWFSKGWTKVRAFDFVEGQVEWFRGGKLNITVNCIDRHLATRGDQPALIWEGDDPNTSKTLTYAELSVEVNKFSNVLRSLGVRKGDRVTIYMPMVLELAVAMLGCARIGAVHCIVFGGFSPDSIKDRMIDANSNVIITTDEGLRGGRAVPMKKNADKAIALCAAEGHEVHTSIVYRRTGNEVAFEPGRDHWWHEVMATASAECEPEVLDAEDPLFILYTSGSTGKPKGVLHTCGGYLLYTATTFKYIFDYHDGDMWWCTADIGWITGHSYIVYGPLANGAQSIMFEGIPTYPEPDRFWRVIDKYKVTQFYTAPTAIRAVMAKGDEYVQRCDLSSLRVLGSVGEPINPEAWMWYHTMIGKKKCPIVDTWWQTETGSIMIAPLPGCIPTKPGSATLPFFGVLPKIVDTEGNEVPRNHGGKLAIMQPWPSMLRTLWGDDERYKKAYFSEFPDKPGVYFTGDGARQDKDGYFMIVGRIDDVLNVSGHRIGTAEIESALVSHPAVAEAAAVGRPDELKGQSLVVFVTLKSTHTASDELKEALRNHVGKEIGALAKPDTIRFAAGLPKTRSGKIMRRLLKELATSGSIKGDTTTLEDFSVISALQSEE